MCNAHNHPPRCTCGWGGEGHLGRRHGRIGGCSSELVAPSRQAWSYHDENFCSPTTCPMCGEQVFFVRHNGGTVWFDELGCPWPKHGCFDEDGHGTRLRWMLANESQASRVPTFGVIIEAEATHPGTGGRVLIRCSDGTSIDEDILTPSPLASLLGLLVIVIRDERGRISFRPVGPTPYTWSQRKSIVEFATKPGFPDNALGKEVILNAGQVGRVVEVINGGRKFRFRDLVTGEVKTYRASHFMQKAVQPSGH